MRYAILADIHANLTALKAVLKDLKDSTGNVDEIWCLGDIVGYGPDPLQCVVLMQELRATCVAGNHDWAAIGKIGTHQFNMAAAEAIAWTRTQLNDDNVKFLESKPLTVVKGDFTLTHGSPRDPIWEYILSEDEAEDNLPYFKTRYCFIGHSHLPLLFECEKSCVLSKPIHRMVIRLGEKRLIFNPGAVGQPRDNDPRASYAIYDNETGRISLRRVNYDILSVQRRMKQAGLPEKLINRLALGL